MKYRDFGGADGLSAPEELAVNRRSRNRGDPRAGAASSIAVLGRRILGSAARRRAGNRVTLCNSRWLASSAQVTA